MKILELFVKYNTSKVRHPIGLNGKPNREVSYCYSCGQSVKNQKYCHNCGKKLLWNKSKKKDNE